MRVILLTLSVATLSSTVFAAKTKVITKKKIKIKGKPFTSYNAAEGDCYLSDKDYLSPNGVHVMGPSSKPALGKMYCKQESCKYGEVGKGAITCDVSGIRDVRSEDGSINCGDEPFDLGHLIGIGEYEMDRGEVTFPSTCRCNSCMCEPCDQKTEVCMQKNGKHGGYQCKKRNKHDL